MPASWRAAKTLESDNTIVQSSHGVVQWDKPELRWVATRGASAQIANVPHLGMARMVGDHVAYYGARSEQNWGDWELFLWNSATPGKPIKLDASDGNAPNAPFLLVAGDAAHLAWLHPLKDGRSEVRLYDVTNQKTRVAHIGHEGAPFIAGDLLVWPEAFAPDTPTRLVAVDLKTLKPAALPGPLAELRDPQEMSADGRTFAWATKDRTKLMAWREGWAASRVIVENPEGNPVTWPKVSGETVSWVDERTYTADLRSGSYAPMTKQYGGAETWGGLLHIGLPKSAGTSYHLDTSKLPPLPTCGQRG